MSGRRISDAEVNDALWKEKRRDEFLVEIRKLKEGKLHDIQAFENKHGYNLPIL